jgi:hypothetical protein
MREKRQKGKEDKREKRKEIRERINRLFKIGLRSKEISKILGIPSRTVRYYLQGARLHRLPLRTRVTNRDIVWIERLLTSGATIEEISEILRLNGRKVFKVIRDQGLANTQSLKPNP